jgi:biotin carboxylase
MNVRLSAPIGILDEHPEWSARLIAELEHRRLPFEKIDHSNHGFDPRDRARRYSVIVNRTSPSSHRRGHGSVLFYAEALLAHWEALGVPVINPVRAYRFEKSKALQIGLFERLGLSYPRTLVVNHRDQVLKASGELRFPVLVKPNIGGSGALIERFDSRADLEARAGAFEFGPDGTALVQEFIESRDGAIVRVEVLDDRYLYAIRIVRPASDFNLCPADICRLPEAPPSGDLGACPVEAKPGLQVSRYDAPPEVVEQARALARAAWIDVGGVEYLVGRDDGRVYFYDVNATSNFVADAPAVLGFDPFPQFADYIVRVATRTAAAPR